MHEITITTNNLGYPRIGAARELKKATEAYWKGKASAENLKDAGRELRARNWQTQREAGIDLIPTNDFSYYDQMLDMSCLLGVVPPRFGWDGAIYAMMFLTLIGAVIWLKIDAGKPLVVDEPTPTPLSA